MRMIRFVCISPIVVLLVSFIVSLGGCSDNGGRNSADGVVTFNGQPLEKGSINFQPLPGTKAPSGGGQIIGGKFKIAADKGLMPGKYRVTVSAYRETGRFVNDPQMGKVADVAPIMFNEEGKLEAEVVADGDNHFEFALTGRK